ARNPKCIDRLACRGFAKVPISTVRVGVFQSFDLYRLARRGFSKFRSSTVSVRVSQSSDVKSKCQ
ncbi:hypothetical protein KI387_037921, partial [Taxus chinensis]